MRPLADSMVASVIEELSLKDQRSKLLREKLAIIQEAQVSAVPAGFAAASNLQLLRQDALLKNFGFQPQVLSTVRTAPFKGPHVLGPEPKVLQNRVLTIRQAGRMAGSSVTFVQKPRESKTSTKATSSTKRARLGLQCLCDRDHLLPPLCRGPCLSSSPFVQAPTEEPAIDPTQLSARRLGRLLQLPQLDNVDGVQVGARLVGFSPQWRSLLGTCWATSTVEDGVGITFLQRPQLTHQCISFLARNSCQDLQQAVDALLSKGAIERVTNVTSLGYYSRLFLVPKKTRDLRPVIDLSTLNSRMVVPHFKMETQGSVRSAIRSQEWTVSIDIRDVYLHVPMHKAVRKYLRFVVNKQVYQFTCLPFGLATSPREFTKLLRPVVVLLRQRGVKLHVYLDDWLIHADTPEQAQLHAQTTISVLKFLGWIINYEKSGLPVHRDAVQHLTVHSVSPTEDASQSPVCSPTLDDQPNHHGPRSSQIAGHGGVYGFTGTTGKTRSSSGPVVGRHSLVPEDRELVRQDHSSSVGSVRGGLLGMSSSPTRSSPCHQGNGSDSLNGCVQFGLGSPVRITLDTGTVVSISKIVAHQRSGDAGRHQRCERLPSSSEVLSGALDVRQRSDCGLHQERGRHTILHTHADDVTPAEVVRSQGDNFDSRPSTRSPQHPGRFPVQSRPDTEHGVDDGHGASTTSVCPVGQTTGRLVYDVRHQTTHQVCIAVSGPQGPVHGRHVIALGPQEGPPVCLSAIQDGPSSTAEDRSVSRCSVDSDCSSAGNSLIFTGVAGSVTRRSHPAVSRGATTADSRRGADRRDDERLVTTGRQIYTHGNSTGHPNGQGPF